MIADPVEALRRRVEILEAAVVGLEAATKTVLSQQLGADTAKRVIASHLAAGSAQVQS